VRLFFIEDTRSIEMRKSEKPFFVSNLTEELKGASSVILVDYSGLTVKLQQDLKKRLKEIGSNMFVAKNRLFKLAGNEAKMPEEVLTDTALTGPTAFIISEEDPIAPLQVIYKFAKEHEIPTFKAGIVDGKFQDKEALKILAQLPSKEVLYGQLMGTIASPMYGLVSTLQGNLQKLVYILKTKSQA